MPEVAVRAGAKLVILNLQQTPLDSLASMTAAVKAGEFLPLVIDSLKSIVDGDNST